LFGSTERRTNGLGGSIRTSADQSGVGDVRYFVSAFLKLAAVGRDEGLATRTDAEHRPDASRRNEFRRVLEEVLDPVVAVFPVAPPGDALGTPKGICHHNIGLPPRPWERALAQARCSEKFGVVLFVSSQYQGPSVRWQSGSVWASKQPASRSSVSMMTRSASVPPICAR